VVTERSAGRGPEQDRPQGIGIARSRLGVARIARIDLAHGAGASAAFRSYLRICRASRRAFVPEPMEPVRRAIAAETETRVGRILSLSMTSVERRASAAALSTKIEGGHSR